MLSWITDHIVPASLAPPGEAEQREANRVRGESQATLARVNRVVDTWHQRAHLDMAEAEVHARVRALEIAEQREHEC